MCKFIEVKKYKNLTKDGKAQYQEGTVCTSKFCAVYGAFLHEHFSVL